MAQNSGDSHSAAALGDLAAATGFYQHALRVEPSLADAEIGLAYVKMQQGDSAFAASMLEKVIATDPTNTLAHSRLSTVYRKLNRSADAQRELEAYQRYKEIKERMRSIYKQMRQKEPDESTTANAAAK